jgi:hypothetical protein
MNGRVSLKRVSSMKSMVFMSKEISTLYLKFHHTDTSIWSTTETWSSRHQMGKRARFGTSTKRHWPSRLD